MNCIRVPARKFFKGVIFEKCGIILKNVVSFAVIIFYNSRINAEATSERVLQESRARV